MRPLSTSQRFCQTRSSPAAPPRAPAVPGVPPYQIPNYYGGKGRYAARDAGRCNVDHLGPKVAKPPPRTVSENIAEVLFGGYE